MRYPNFKIRKLSAVVKICSYALIASSPAFAADKEAGSSRLEEVIVTSEKVEKDVQDLSQSIVAISSEEIAKTAVTSLDQLIRNVPGLNVQGGFNNLYMRGVGSNQNNGEGGEPGVAVNIDGASAYSGSRAAALSTLVDIERVEVLRGPQGTLYGRNAVGGQVNVVTKNPVFDAFEGSVGVKTGNYNLKSYNGVINIPVNETFALRGTLLKETRDGYIHDADRNPVSGDADVINGRLKALWEPNEKLSVLGTFSYVKDVSDTSMGVPNINPELNADGTLWELFPGGPTAPGHPNDPWLNNTGQVPASPAASKTTIYQLDISYDLDFADLTFIPSKTKIETICPASNPTCVVSSPSQESYELRLSSKADSDIEWTVGVYMLDQAGSAAPTATGLTLSTEIDGSEIRSGTNADGDTLVELATAQMVLPTKNSAVFGQFTYPLTEDFRVKLGARYSKESKKNKFITYGLQGSTASEYMDSAAAPGSTCIDCVIVFQNDAVLEDTDDNPFTYTAGLEYDIAENNMVYAMVSSGFKAGGIAPVVIPPKKYESEKLTSYSLGSKNRFMDDSLQVNAEAYWYKYSNYQINIANEDAVTMTNGGVNYTDPNEFRSIVYNAGQGDIYGAEVETIFAPTAEDYIRFNVAYSKGTYGNLLAPLGGPPFLPAEFNLTGGELAFQPRWTANLGYSHDFILGDWILTPRIDLKYSDSYLVTPEGYLANFPAFIGGGKYETEQDAYHKVDAYLNLVSADGKYSINAFGRNLNNSAEIEFLNPGGVAVSAPKTYGIGLNIKF